MTTRLLALLLLAALPAVIIFFVAPALSPAAPAAIPLTSDAAPLTSDAAGAPQPSALRQLALCGPGDQDDYVYSPGRLVTERPCVRIAGAVVDIQRAEDGDFHIDIRVDTESSSILNAGNIGEGGGFLIVEPVCVHSASPIAERLCAADPDPLDMSKLAVGQHVWMEGRYVTDSEHHDWAELHPLYAWGLVGG